MKKSTKKALTGAVIFITTLLTGFSITAISFNLFDIMTQNQMRMIFAVDVILLLLIGTVAWFVYESRIAKKNRKNEFIKRHNERLEKIEKQQNDIINILNSENFAA